jgi:hypothetical protein
MFSPIGVFVTTVKACSATFLRQPRDVNVSQARSGRVSTPKRVCVQVCDDQLPVQFTLFRCLVGWRSKSGIHRLPASSGTTRKNTASPAKTSNASTKVPFSSLLPGLSAATWDRGRPAACSKTAYAADMRAGRPRSGHRSSPHSKSLFLTASEVIQTLRSLTDDPSRRQVSSCQSSPSSLSL